VISALSFVRPAVTRDRDHLRVRVDSDGTVAAVGEFGDRATRAAADVHDRLAGGQLEEVVGAGAQVGRAGLGVGGVEQPDQRFGGLRGRGVGGHGDHAAT